MEGEKTMWDAYLITEKGDGKSQWNKVGIAFLNQDQSINVFLEAFPKDGKVQLRKRQPKNSHKEN